MRDFPRPTALVATMLATLTLLAGCGSSSAQRPASAAATRPAASASPAAPASPTAPASPAAPSKPAWSLSPEQAAECAAIAAAYQTWLTTAPSATAADAQAITMNQNLAYESAVRSFEAVLRLYHDLPAATLALAVANYDVAMAKLGMVLVGSEPKTDEVYAKVANTVQAVRDGYADFQATAC